MIKLYDYNFIHWLDKNVHMSLDNEWGRYQRHEAFL